MFDDKGLKFEHLVGLLLGIGLNNEWEGRLIVASGDKWAKNNVSQLWCQLKFSSLTNI